jgi:hypothetical protein
VDGTVRLSNHLRGWGDISMLVDGEAVLGVRGWEWTTWGYCSMVQEPGLVREVGLVQELLLAVGISIVYIR